MNLSGYFRLQRTGIFSSAINNFEPLPIFYGYLGAPTSEYYNNVRIRKYYELPLINYNDATDGGAAQYKSYFVGWGNCSTSSARPFLFSDGTGGVAFLSSYYHHSTIFEGQNISFMNFPTSFNPIGPAYYLAGGNGKASDGDSTTPIENPIDIIENFLCHISTFSPLIFDDISKNKARDFFNENSYKAGLIIFEDDSYWNIIQKVMGSFGGYAYINAMGRVCFSVLTTVVDPYSIKAIIPKAEIELVSAKQKAENLINRCPVSYDYSPYEQKFYRHHDPTSNVNLVSQNAFGKQEPLMPVGLYAVYDSTTAEKIQKLFVEKYCTPKWEITFEDLTLKRAHLDVGDVVVASFDELYQKDGNPFTNRGLEIIGIQPDYAAGKVQFRAWDLGVNMDSSHLLSTSTSYDRTEY